MSFGKNCLSRRRLLGCGICWLGGSMLAMLTPLSGVLAGMAIKADFLYQDHPHDGKSCAQCKYFLRDSGDNNTGTCAIVEGAINRNGWCMAYSPKS